jgi:ParB-like chromosome segregation protein Spo0J
MQTLSLTQIRRDGGTQTRAMLDLDTVDEYAEQIEAGVKFPPVVVFFDGNQYWLADGFHRFQATENCGLDEIDCDIRQGTQRDAILHSVGANAAHGLKRSNADKRRAVEMLLRDDEWSKWSNVRIAKACHVDEGTVRNYREAIIGNSDDRTPRKVERNGTVYEQKRKAAKSDDSDDLDESNEDEAPDDESEIPEPAAPEPEPDRVLTSFIKFWNSITDDDRSRIRFWLNEIDRMDNPQKQGA